MVRTYKRKVGARKYRNFSTEELSKACCEILNKKISYREAAKKYNISLGCLAKHIKVFQMQKQINEPQASEMEDESTSNTQTDCGPISMALPSTSDATPSTRTSTSSGIRATSLPSTPRSITSIASSPSTIPIYKPGHPTVFTALEEAIFADYICLISEWGFPIDSFGLRKLAKSYLDSNGRCVPTFKDNTPGRDWSRSFLKRHQPILSQRMCQNIKYARATTNEEDLTNYFNHLQASEVQVIPTGNILNYDETNMVDDPKSKKMIFKRSLKRSERVMNFTKSATSVMFACSDDGQLLPPYVVYKAEGMWSTWTLGGPPGTRYNRTKSGWFDECCFLDWFHTIVVPWAKKRDGKKMLIGDNLSSHFSGEIIQKCNELNISFICLPPNTTHLTQPLDVGVYGPLKKEWRKALESWKLGPGRKRPTLSKDEFPSILNKVLNNMKEKISKNIKSGFLATGIRPFDKEQVIKRLPKKSLANQKDSEEEKARKESLMSSQIGAAVLGILQELRSKKTPEGKRKRSKINVTPGKSVSLDEIGDNPDDPSAPPTGVDVGTNSSKQSLEISTKKTSKSNKKRKEKKGNLKKEIKKEDLGSKKEKKKTDKTKKMKNIKRKRKNWEDSSDSTDDLTSVEYDDDSIINASLGFSDLEDEDIGIKELSTNEKIHSFPAPEDSMPGSSKQSSTKDTTEPTPGSWVVVKYASKRDIFHYFIGQVIHSYERGCEIKFLRNQGNNKFIWPPKDDYDNVPYPDIVKVLPEPTMVSSRGSGIFTFSMDLSGYNII